jgi:hypothetical protein
MERRKHKSQFDYGGTHADDRTLALTARDVQVLRLLDPEHGYYYLPSHWIHAFVGGDALRVAKRLGRLAREPHSYLARRQDWYKHAVYSRTTKADRFLGERRTRDRDPYPHRLLQDMVHASIVLGLKDYTALELVPWLGLAATGKVPAATLDSAEPHAIPLKSGAIVPDGKPFAIKRGVQWRFVLGVEIDRGTEPLATGHARRSIKQKLENYAECFAEKRYASHYGFPNSLVLFVATSPERMKSMMALTESVIGACSFLCFAHTSDWALAPRFPPPNGDLLGPYLRVGHPPLHLANFGET